MIISKRTTPKPCKGTGKAKGFGCGDLITEHTYGLCRKGNKCFNNFLLSDNGKEVIQKTKIRASNVVKKEAKKSETERKRQTINYAGKLQEKVQEIARLIDMGHPCLARNKMALSSDGGHCFGKGSHPECKYNLHNIFAQDSKSNQSTKEDALMTEGLRREFGERYFLFVEGLKNKPPQKHLKPEIEKMYRRASAISNKLRKEGIVRSKEERITLRNQINLEIGFYPPELCVYE